MRASRLVWTLGVATALAALSALVTLGQSVTSNDAEVIRGPAAWVPLTYDLTYRQDGVPVFSYRIYRSSSGSMKQERSDGRQAWIANQATNKFYRLHGGQWYEHPMRPQPAEGRPFLTLARKSVTQVEPSDPRVYALASLGTPMTFFELRNGPETSKIFCVELNLLEVWAQRPLKGSGRPIIEIQVTAVFLGEPPNDFAPPGGASIIQRSEPDGPGSVR